MRRKSWATSSSSSSSFSFCSQVKYQQEQPPGPEAAKEWRDHLYRPPLPSCAAPGRREPVPARSRRRVPLQLPLRPHLNERWRPHPRELTLLQLEEISPPGCPGRRSPWSLVRSLCSVRRLCPWAGALCFSRHLVEAVVGGCGQGHCDALLLMPPP